MKLFYDSDNLVPGAVQRLMMQKEGGSEKKTLKVMLKKQNRQKPKFIEDLRSERSQRGSSSKKASETNPSKSQTTKTAKKEPV